MDPKKPTLRERLIEVGWFALLTIIVWVNFHPAIRMLADLIMYLISNGSTRN